MQTFLPFESFEISARSLDYRRLGKQRVEAHDILKVLWGFTYRKHKIIEAWRGYEDALVAYYVAICDAWMARGYRMEKLPILEAPTHYERPLWTYDPQVHRMYKQLLVYKNPQFYCNWGTKFIEKTNWNLLGV